MLREEAREIVRDEKRMYDHLWTYQRHICVSPPAACVWPAVCLPTSWPTTHQRHICATSVSVRPSICLPNSDCGNDVGSERWGTSYVGYLEIESQIVN